MEVRQNQLKMYQCVQEPKPSKADTKLQHTFIIYIYDAFDKVQPKKSKKSKKIKKVFEDWNNIAVTSCCQQQQGTNIEISINEIDFEETDDR